ncbi:tyrosine-type recombinase/integrase [Sphingomonas nostoxanthinifaciens]|uniref:tyrosine-type recombinase/integrase n=1 Tax=Sphingomonas nostoxanthinifaciens TaxID=2872652 RepID=UPI001CC1E7FB|nr:tyrosine-type recombinase/integrase [Sphingomonas nostoxanthinifaciens]UAK24377.1 tyrosine-type recombinase/integrase [Sphingomonas nostoxanthinifaciens]
MIEGLHFVRVAATASRPIRWYVYAWRGGPRIMTWDGPVKPKLTKDALAAYAAATEGATKAKGDTLTAAIIGWRGRAGEPDSASPEWKKLAENTKRVWGLALDQIDAKWGKHPIKLWNDPRMVADVVGWRDARAKTPRAADIGITVLAQLLQWCRLRAKVTINVAADIPTLYAGADRAEIIWTDDDLARFKAAADKENRPRVYDAIRLATLTGFRRADLAAVTFDEVSDHAIIRVALKKSRGRRRRAVIPMIPELAKLIEELRALPRNPGVNTLLVNSRGRSWTPGSLGAAVDQIRNEAKIFQPGSAELGVPDRPKHLHDCRGTFVTKLCRAGLTDREIADAAAWSPQSVATIRKFYVDDAAVVVALSKRMRRVL